MQLIYRNYAKICSVWHECSLFPFFFFILSSLWKLCDENISIVFSLPWNVSPLKVQGQATVSNKFYCYELESSPEFI